MWQLIKYDRHFHNERSSSTRLLKFPFPFTVGANFEKKISLVFFQILFLFFLRGNRSNVGYFNHIIDDNYNIV